MPGDAAASTSWLENGTSGAGKVYGEGKDELGGAGTGAGGGGGGGGGLGLGSSEGGGDGDADGMGKGIGAMLQASPLHPLMQSHRKGS